MDKSIMVSVWCAAYNHELYIRDAIESFLNQTTNFKYEIIIHDDASTDKTVEIIKEYEAKYPEIIHGIYQAENQYKRQFPSTEWIQIIHRENCKGKYIAWCEGDDYWIDSNKLQIQIDYMEKHTECIMTTHNAIDINYKKGDVKTRNPFKQEGDLAAEQIIMQQNGHLPTASIVYRKEIAEMQGFFLETGIGDYPIELYSLSKGVIHYFDRIMSVYRCEHQGSYGESLYLNQKKYFFHCIGLISFLEQYNRYTNKKYEKYVVNRMQGFVDEIINSYTKKTREQFVEICREYDRETGYKFHEYMEEIIRIFSLLFDDESCEKELFKYCKENQKIYIMGAGKYAGVIAKKLDKYDIGYQGFVVSDDQKYKREYLNKQVWKFSELRYKERDAAFIIGINPCIWGQIIEQLEKENIINYYCPFLVSV